MKKHYVIGMTLAALLALVSCGGQSGASSAVSSETISSESSESLDSSKSSESVDPSEESIPSSEGSILSSEDSEGESEESLEPEDPAIEVTVAGALSAIEAMEANKRSQDKYAVTGYIREITEEHVPQLRYLSFTIADSMDSADVLLSYRTFALDRVDYQEYTPGTKVTLTGRLMKSVDGDSITPMMVSPEDVTVVESLLVDATKLEIQDLTVTAGKEKDIEFVIEPQNGRLKRFEFTVAKPSIASIDGTRVKGLSAGVTSVKAVSEDETLELTFNITVEEDTSSNIKIGFDKYKDSGAPTSAMAASNVIDWCVSSNANLIEECTEASLVFLQPGCIRLGKSEGGVLSFTLKEAIKVQSVIFSVQKYGSDASNIMFSASNYSETLAWQGANSYLEFNDVTYDLGGVTLNDFTISNSTKRIFVRSITFILAE